MGIAADFVLIVVAGLFGGMIARALRLPLLVGYVLAGIVVGPHTAGPTVSQIKDIETLAEIGVALLLFSIGLEVSFRDLGTVKRVALVGGTLQMALLIGLGAAAGRAWLGIPGTEAIWLGSMISVSSTMVVLKVLAANGVMSTLASRVMIGLLVLQDLAVIPLLIVLPQLGKPENLAGRVAASLAVAAGLLAAIFFAGTRLLPPLLRAVLRWGSRELFLVAVVATGVGVGAATHAAGFSFAVGAFAAGLILSESEFSHQALADVVPLRDVFGLLFFVSVGMLFDPAYALANAGRIAVAVVLIMAGKAVVIGVTTRWFGYWNMAPWLVGLGLCQIGEFSFVLAREGLGAGLVSKPVYDLTLTATVMTMALSPMVSRLALPLGRLWQHRFGRRVPGEAAAAAPAGLTGHAIVGGYGRTGQTVARALRAAGTPVLLVESNYALIADLATEGFAGTWGDVTSPEILHAAGIERASLLILTMPDAAAVQMAVERARALQPGLAVIARSAGVAQGRALREAGAVAAVQPEFEGGLEMARLALLQGGYGESGAGEAVARLRDEASRGE